MRCVPASAPPPPVHPCLPACLTSTRRSSCPRRLPWAGSRLPRYSCGGLSFFEKILNQRSRAARADGRAESRRPSLLQVSSSLPPLRWFPDSWGRNSQGLRVCPCLIAMEFRGWGCFVPWLRTDVCSFLYSLRAVRGDQGSQGC